MATEIKVPALGESIVEATVGHWLKHEGDPVRAGEALVELETEKVNLEVAADQDGVLAHIARREGETVAIGDVLGTLGTTTDHRPPTTDNRRPTTAGSTMAPASAAVADGQPSVVELPDDTRATPVARRYAAEHGLDVAQIPGSGPGGRVTKEDVVRAAETAAPAPRRRGEPERGATTDDRRPTTESAPTVPSPTVVGGSSSVVAPTERPEERVRMTRRRQTIARRLVEAQQTTAMLTTFNEIDMGPVMELRKRRREWFQQRYGVKLGFMSFFVKATVAALRAFPELNAEIQRDEIVLKKYYDIGIAVGAPGGLVVPVVRDADRQSFAEIEKQIEAYGQKATDGTLSITDLTGGTFTITNGGVFGSLMSTPILNPPQVGILGMHKIQERPIARDGQVLIQPMMYVALSYDHRIVDGREAVQFLVRIKEQLEDPEILLFEG